jgi:hypothetical protein
VERQRQRNDRLGRKWPFEHRRKILRRCSGSDTHANTFSDANRYSYADGHCERYTHGNPEDRSHAKSSADARTAPIAPQHQDRGGGSGRNATLSRCEAGAVSPARNLLKTREFFFHFGVPLHKLGGLR